MSEDDIGDILQKIGEVACVLLDMLPSDSFSFNVEVSEECTIQFTVKKV